MMVLSITIVLLYLAVFINTYNTRQMYVSMYLISWIWYHINQQETYTRRHWHSLAIREFPIDEMLPFCGVDVSSKHSHKAANLF